MNDRRDDAAAGRGPRTAARDTRGGPASDVGRDRLETIAWADNRTAALDPHPADADTDPVQDLAAGRRSDAEYREEAARLTRVPGAGDDEGR